MMVTPGRITLFMLLFLGALARCAEAPIIACAMPEAVQLGADRLLPAAGFAEVIDAQATEDLLTGATTLTRGRDTAVFTPDSTAALVRGLEVALPCAARRIGGTLYVPAEPLLRAFGGTLVDTGSPTLLLAQFADDTKMKFACRPLDADPQQQFLGTELYLLRLDGSGLRRLTYDINHQLSPRLSPDGRRLLTIEGKTLVVRDVTARTGDILLADPALGITSIDAAEFIEDGAAILCTLTMAKVCCLCRVQLDGTEFRTLARKATPSFSVRAGGRQVAYAAYTEDNVCQIHLVDTDGQHDRILAEGTRPILSQDGATLAFRKDTPGGSRYYLTPVDEPGGKPIDLQAKVEMQHIGLATPSPTGAHCIIVLRKANTEEGCWTINADGTGAAKITPFPMTDCRYTPDGSRIVGTDKGRLLSMQPDGTDLTWLMATYNVREFAFTPDGQSLLVSAWPR